jgi:tetratricopeptide (TPR) repeat protein
LKLLSKLFIAGSMGLIAAAFACVAQTSGAQDSRRSDALALEQQGRVADAVVAWQAIAKAHPGDAEAYAHLGLLEARDGHYKEAIPFYRKALGLNPQIPGLRLNLGLAYFKAGSMRSAVATFEPLLREAQPGSAEALRLNTLIGLAQYGMGEYASAVPFLKTVTAADPANLQFRFYLAQSCLWSKQYQCVLDVYREILTLNAVSAEADMLAGEAYDEMKDEAHALQEFEAAVKAGPDTPDVHFGYGYLLWRALRFDEAEKEFKAELANNPAHPLALTYLGDVEIRANRSDEAVPYLVHAIQIQPSIALAHLDLGAVYATQGRSDDAVRELREAERLSPKDPKIHWQLGRLYQTLGRTAEAKAELDKSRNLQDAADQSVVEKLRPAQSTPPGTNAGVDTK